MGRARQHRRRPRNRGFLAGGMERSRGSAEPSRIGPDVVQAKQAVVAVEGRVFDGFGHHRACRLLEPPGELVFDLAAVAEQEQVADELEQLGLEVAT